MDVELGRETDPYKAEVEDEGEQESLLQPNGKTPVPPSPNRGTFAPRAIFSLVSAFIGGIVTCLALQYIFSGKPSSSITVNSQVVIPGEQNHKFPPPSPTNVFPSYFPTNVGYPGPTETGEEAALVATAPSYPVQTSAPQLLGPSLKNKTPGFDLFKSWGNLSPWYSVGNAFGLDSGPETPKGCRVTAMHLLHRHGARYPTSWSDYAGPTKFAHKLRKAQKWLATGKLDFLNHWTYALGSEVLTPFGRQQLFDLGVSMRIKYGNLLQNFTDANMLPVFRTESQDRMLHSALNFAAGFFGIPFQDKYQQSILIEAPGFNNTLAPYKTCPNAITAGKGMRSLPYVEQWANIYLKDAVVRLRSHLKGFDLTTEDAYSMQQLCAYETVALGYSAFCELFTLEEWKGFEYSLDLFFWYDYGFGSPTSRALGIGWVQELISRITRTPVSHQFSTNSTLDDNPITFPLGQSLYVDATHEVVVLEVLVALNLSNFAASGPLPADHIPANRSFIASEIVPFATNLQFQLLSCDAPAPGGQIRVILNDGVVPLTGVKGCPKQSDGMCPVDTFIKSQREIISGADWYWTCNGDWKLPSGPKWQTTTGDPPKKS